MIKLHLGCGPVYLKGYLNIDAKGELSSDNPDLVKFNQTTVNNYFKHKYVIKKFGHNKRGKIVVDLRQNIIDLSNIPDESVSEILTVNVINHMRLQDFLVAIKDWNRILKKGGLLITDVDDVIDNCKLVLKAKTKEDMDMALRYLFCHSRDKYDSHHWGYTEWYLKELLKEFGFKFVWRNDKYINHNYNYPRFITCFKKI